MPTQRLPWPVSLGRGQTGKRNLNFIENNRKRLRFISNPVTFSIYKIKFKNKTKKIKRNRQSVVGESRNKEEVFSNGSQG